MVDQAKRIPDLPVKTSVAPTDQLVFVFGAANSSTAQTALLAVSDLYSNTIADPSSNSELQVPKGTLLFSNNFGYIALANNYVKRFAISDF